MLASKSSGNLPSSSVAEARAISPAAVAILLAALGLAAALWCWNRGYTLYDGDAEAHLNIARRILDSRTPGPEQIGTGWLPLPHLLMLPLAMHDAWWKNGLAGALPSAVYFAMAGAFLFAAARRVFDSTVAAMAATLLFALNPNALYLGSVPMTEMLFAASLAALLWATLWFRDTKFRAAIVAAAVASNAASLTRYEGWFLVPFAALFLWFTARRKSDAVIFAALAALGPLAWLAHNQYYYSNPVEFYNGPWSAMAMHQRELVQGVVVPTDHNWIASIRYYLEATRLVAGTPLALLGVAGILVGLLGWFRRQSWSLAFLALTPLFYLWSLHSAGADLYVPTLWPYTAYNTRYALPALMLAAFAGGALALLVPNRLRLLVVVGLVGLASLPWIASTPVCWREAYANSLARRDAQHQAAAFIEANYRAGAGIVLPLGELSGVMREAGIPLRESLHEGNHPAWEAMLAAPGLLLHEEWALANAGDEVDQTVAKAVARGRPYRLRKQVIVKGAPVVDIYHLDSLEDPLRQSPRRP